MSAKPDPKTKERRGPVRPHAKKAVVEAGDALDRLIHEPLRLRIMSALAVTATMSFNELRDLLAASDGNLSVHARKLEEAGYLVCEKSFEGRVPKTTFALTAQGRRALDEYLARMESIIKGARRS